MYEKKYVRKTVVVKKRVMNVGGIGFQVPYGTTHYRGYLHFKVNSADEEEAIRSFEEICAKENILLGTNVEYDYREYEDPNDNVLFVEGDFLIFAYSEEEIKEKLDRNHICNSYAEEIDSCKFAVTEEVVE